MTDAMRTNTVLRRIWNRRHEDSGVALLTVILWTVAVSAIGSVVAVSGVIALNSTNSDRAATSALGTTDAGIAEALSYIRSQSIGIFTCTEPLNPSSSTWDQISGCGYNVSGANPWIDPFAPQTISGGKAATACATGVSCYQVWIGTLQKYQPAQGDQSQPGTPGVTAAVPEVLRIHSTGFSGTGPGARAATEDVALTAASFPIGVYSSAYSEHAHHTPIANESLFAVGDVGAKCPLTGVDLAYNIPAAIHAGGTITYQSPSCTASGDPTNPCTLADPYDQDSHGVALTSSSPCYNYDQTDSQFTGLSPAIKAYPQTTYFTANSLSDYGYRPGGLTPSEYASLKEVAQAEGTYDNEANLSTTLANLVAAGVTNPVVYDDNGTYPSPGDFPSQFTRSASDATVPGTSDSSGNECTAYSATIIATGAISPHWTGSLVASVFFPQGSFTFTGNGTVIGTLFANSITFEGKSPHFELDECFVSSPPSGVLDVTTYNYNGTDVGNLQ